MKKLFMLLVCILLVLLCASALADVAINETNFPDANFRAYVGQFDTDGNGSFSTDELQAVSRIDCSADNLEDVGIASLKGIEFFTGLKTLRCSNNTSLTDIDISKNTELTELTCSCTYALASIDISHNTKLVKLCVSHNKLTSLNVGRNTLLEHIDCTGNQITELDVSNNPLLYSLYCDYNHLTSLDVSRNTALTTLVCDEDYLSELDVSNNYQLTTLGCSNNQLSSLDVTNNYELYYLHCGGNPQLGSLDVSCNANLRDLWCQNCQLNSLDISFNPVLEELWCFGNNFSFLDISCCPELCDLVQNNERHSHEWHDADCFGDRQYWESQLMVGKNVTVIAGDFINTPDGQAAADVTIDETNFPDAAFREYVRQFDMDGGGVLSITEIAGVTSIDVSNMGISSLKGIEYFTALTHLYCRYNSLETLDISNNAQLALLWCDSNNLTSLDVTNNRNLEHLDCCYNNLSELNVRNNTLLYELEAFGNSLTAIDVSQNTALTYLHLENNQLTSLDVSNSTELRTLYCGNNSLTSLTLGNLPYLENFGCDKTRLKTLDIRGCAKLESMANSADPAPCRVDDSRTYFGWMVPAPEEDYWPLACFFVDKGIKITTSSGTIDTGSSETTVSLNKATAKLTRTAKKTKPTVKLTATVEPAEAAEAGVEWSSSDPKVAKVDQNGKVTALKKGKAVITCKAKDGSGASAQCTVTIKNKLVTKIKLNKTKAALSITLSKKGTVQLKTTVTPSDALNSAVTWKSSNKKVATVSSKGKVTAVGYGTCKITATAKDGSGVKATCKITVTVDEVKDIDLKYSLDHKNLTATVTGPLDKSIYQANLASTVKANGKTYKVTAIAAKAFKGMKKLVGFNTGKNLTTIGASAFENCKKLNTIGIQSKHISKIGKSAFKGLTQKVNIYLSSDLKETYINKIVKLLVNGGLFDILKIFE